MAFKNQSPQQQNNNKVNCNKDMNKKLIRLTEGDLHRIIKESVNNVLTENNYNFYNEVYDCVMNSLISMFGDELVNFTGDGIDVTNPQNTESFININFYKN